MENNQNLPARKELRFSGGTIKKTVNLYKKLQLVGLVINLLTLGFILLVYFAQVIYDHGFYDKIITLIWGIVTTAGLYYGFKHKESWVPPLITFITSLSLIVSLTVTLTSQPPHFTYQAAYIIFVVIRFMLWLWDIFTIYFFTRKEVKEYFKVKDTTLFSG